MTRIWLAMGIAAPALCVGLPAKTAARPHRPQATDLKQISLACEAAYRGAGREAWGARPPRKPQRLPDRGQARALLRASRPGSLEYASAAYVLAEQGDSVDTNVQRLVTTVTPAIASPVGLGRRRHAGANSRVPSAADASVRPDPQSRSHRRRFHRSRGSQAAPDRRYERSREQACRALPLALEQIYLRTGNQRAMRTLLTMPCDPACAAAADRARADLFLRQPETVMRSASPDPARLATLGEALCSVHGHKQVRRRDEALRALASAPDDLIAQGALYCMEYAGVK